MMREAQDLEDILDGYPIKEGVKLYARATCPCCGRCWFADVREDGFNVHFKTCKDSKRNYVCTVTCENCNLHIDDCELVDEAELKESYKNFGKENA